MRPPSACTAFVTLRCLATCQGMDRRPPNGFSQPSMFGALRKVGGQLVEIAGAILQAGMHRTHQHPVGQGHMAKIERGKQVWVAHGCLQFKRLYEDARKRVV